MARLSAFLQRRGGPLAVLVFFLVLVLILWSYSGPPPGPTGEAVPWWDKWAVFLLVGFVLVFVGWFLYIFTGDVDQKMTHMIIFSYLFTIFSLLGSVLPFVAFPLVPGLYRVMHQSPVGIVAGCSRSSTGEPKSTPKELECDNNTDQWVVNIGGTIDIDGESKTPAPQRTEGRAEPAKALQGQSGGTSAAPAGGIQTGWPLVHIRGGLVVPLYFVVLSLMGGAVSMTRRVPEYQWRRTLPENHEKHMTPERVRESLVFQIMQVISAPLIAVTAYYLVDPASRATSVALAFTSGFASETVLMAIRALVDKLKPAT